MYIIPDPVQPAGSGPLVQPDPAKKTVIRSVPDLDPPIYRNQGSKIYEGELPPPALKWLGIKCRWMKFLHTQYKSRDVDAGNFDRSCSAVGI